LTLFSGPTAVGQLNLFTPFVAPNFSLASDGGGGTLVTVGSAAPPPPPNPPAPPPNPVPTAPSSTFDFLYRYNDGHDYYYGRVVDNGTFGYQVGQQLSMADGSYTIFNQEAGTTATAVGSVFVDYFSHGGFGQASTSPIKSGAGLPDGAGGLGTEADAILGTDGQAYAFASGLEPQLAAGTLFGFVFAYPDGRLVLFRHGRR
jgi:hypothetical protein